MDWLPLILFSVFIGWVLYSNFTKKGKAQVRGGEIEKTFDFSIEEVKQMNKLLLQALDYSNTET